ncbi:MAG TPA: DUF58 domain-containing protein [Chloroflexota bacterium]|nr:DUF58 domain-containing protein [Chloroflexota bacterium]
MPTRRLFLLLLLAAPLGAAGEPLVLIGIAIAILALLAASVDWWLAGDGRRVRAQRVLGSDKLSLGAWNLVQVELSNQTARPQRVLLRDLPPLSFALDLRPPVFKQALPASAHATHSYHVQPPHRGDAAFGDLHLRVEGPLRLVRRSFKQAGTAQPVRVYPNLRELRRYDLLVRRGLEVQPVGRPVRVAGASTEFERVREYLPDDEFRRINWKATARRGQPMVNQFEAERSQNLVVMLDAGRSMAALADVPRAADADDEEEAGPAPNLTKLDHALNAAVLLAYVASQRGDRVALLAYVDDVRAFVPPQRGRRALLATVAALYNLRAEPIEPDHGRAFDFLGQRNLRRSLVVLFTDLADSESSASLAAHLMRAAHQHLVVCVTLGDPNVRRPAQRRPADGASLYEKMVAQQLLDERAAVLARLAAHGVLTVDTDADTLNPKLIGTYLELKQRGRL